MDVTVNHLSFYFKQHQVINDLSFQIKTGDFLTILGPNGTGKSTLVKCLTQLYTTKKNTILLNNIDSHQFKDFQSIAYVPQRAHNLNLEIPMTVSELLQTATTKKVSLKQKKLALKYVNMSEFLNVTTKKLSGGQLQRVLIARSLINSPTLLILDEPTVGIDKENLDYFFQTLRHLHAQGMTIILITHDSNFTVLPNTHVLTLRYLSHDFQTIESYDQTHCHGGCHE